MTVIDTNVLVYSCDALEPKKQSQAKQLFRQLALVPGSTLIPWQVTVEL